MDAAKWKIVKAKLAEALERPVDEREEFLNGLAPDIRTDVERLASAGSPDGFIDKPLFVDEASLGSNSARHPEQVDDYRLISEIGTGGMGTVFLAEQTGEGFSQKVALKLIKRGMDTNSVLKRFLMERQILANLEHPNIARMLDGGSTAEGGPYFVMELVDGDEIRKYCNDNSYGLTERLVLFRKVCNAVSSAHQKLVVHRDLKPTNILVTKDGEPKLLDFGIAKLLSPDWNDDTHEATVTQFRVMTPEYASPEQIAGEATSTSTDVYSLGVILFELLTGGRPFQTRGKAPKELLDSVLSNEPPRPSTVSSGLTSGKDKRTDGKLNAETGESIEGKKRSETAIDRKLLQGDLDNIILKAIRREPERRYRSVEEFSEDIRRYLEGLPVNATADSRSYRFRKFLNRNKKAVIGTAAAALLLLTATGVTGWQYTVAQRERQIAEKRFNDTRTLAKSVLYELYDAIEAVPGSTKAKELLAAKALEYLDRLAAEGSNDPYLLAELADGYLRIGNIQGGYGQANLGQTAEAKASYEKSFEILRSIVDSGATDPKFKAKLAAAYARKADAAYLETDLQGYYENHKLALELLVAAEPEKGEDLGLIFELGAAYLNAGRGAAVVNKIDEGIATMKKGTEIFEALVKRDSGSDRYVSGLIFAYDTLGEIYSGTGQKESALAEFRKARTLIEPIVKERPNNTDVLRISVVVHTSIAGAASDIGQYDEALTSADIAVEHARRIGSSDAGNLDAEMLTSLTAANRGRVLARSGKWQEGIAVLQNARKAFAKVVESDPDNTIAPFQLAGIDDELGRAYLAMGLAEPNRSAKREALLKARPLLQKAYDVYKRYRDEGITVAEDAAVTDEVAALITQCDQALALLK